MQYEVLNYCEFDKKAADIYELFHEEAKGKNLGDITKVTEEQIKLCDILFTSSPCTSVSNIGLREGAEKDSGTASSLMWNNIQFIKNSKPKIIIFENVPSIAKGKNKKNFDDYILTMKELGYTSIWKEMNPIKYSGYQNRNRIFVVSIRNDLDASIFSMPIETGKHGNMFDLFEKNVPESYIVPDYILKGFDNKTSIFRERFLVKKPGDYSYTITTHGKWNVITNNFILNDWDMYNSLPEDFNYGDVHYFATHPGLVRALTSKECFRLQGISDEYYDKAVQYGMSENQRYIRCGNGIEVNTVYLVFKKIYETYPDIFENMKYISLFSGIGCELMALKKLYKEINDGNRK